MPFTYSMIARPYQYPQYDPMDFDLADHQQLSTYQRDQEEERKNQLRAANQELAKQRRARIREELRQYRLRKLRFANAWNRRRHYEKVRVRQQEDLDKLAKKVKILVAKQRAEEPERREREMIMRRVEEARQFIWENNLTHCMCEKDRRERARIHAKEEEKAKWQ
ncbi:hypothetical protein SBOR_3501 [Sclerotinia borealis F-4128]|uniref:Uncharacterized protein n=1 Tax=Sclerotinia borealis (strain F-4128) TaxID=1432307 RepID=W9CH85_SCLBF|nr:hypothetical protein SBOR_3501 [Sclerotinia borealis F-4128]